MAAVRVAGIVGRARPRPPAHHSIHASVLQQHRKCTTTAHAPIAATHAHELPTTTQAAAAPSFVSSLSLGSLSPRPAAYAHTEYYQAPRRCAAAQTAPSPHQACAVHDMGRHSGRAHPICQISDAKGSLGGAAGAAAAEAIGGTAA